MEPELTLEDLIDLAPPEDRDEATFRTRIGRGTPGYPDVWVTDMCIAEMGHREAKRMVRRIYEGLHRR